MTQSVGKAISLFSGMGGDSLGMKEAGFDVVAFNEFDKAAVKSHLENFPDSTLIQDASQKKEKDKTDIILVKDEAFSAYKGQVDLIFAGHPCFVAGTKVLTKDGYKIFESDFTQVTEFKSFDQSWNGNHLVKFDEANII